MAKKELRMRAMVAPTQTVVASAYDSDGKPQACGFTADAAVTPKACARWRGVAGPRM